MTPPPALFCCDEFPVGYSSAGSSPAVPASASPTANDSQQPMLPYNDFAANGNNPLNSVSQLKGALQLGVVLPIRAPSQRVIACGGSRRKPETSGGRRSDYRNAVFALR